MAGERDEILMYELCICTLGQRREVTSCLSCPLLASTKGSYSLNAIFVAFPQMFPVVPDMTSGTRRGKTSLCKCLWRRIAWWVFFPVYELVPAQSRFPNSRNRLPLGFNFLLRFTVPSRATSKHMNDFCTVMLWSLICGQSCLLWYEDVVNKIEQWGSAVCPMWLCHWWFHSDACSCLLD